MEQLSGEHGYMMMRENQSLGMQRPLLLQT